MDAAVNTLYNCAQETLVDGMARERQMGLTGWGPILDHSIGFYFDCWHYYMYTGDLSGLEEVYPRLMKFFSYLQSLTDHRDGLVPSEGLGMCSVYIDHLAYKKDRHKQLTLTVPESASVELHLGSGRDKGIHDLPSGTHSFIFD